MGMGLGPGAGLMSHRLWPLPLFSRSPFMPKSCPMCLTSERTKFRGRFLSNANRKFGRKEKRKLDEGRDKNEKEKENV